MKSSLYAMLGCLIAGALSIMVTQRVPKPPLVDFSDQCFLALSLFLPVMSIFYLGWPGAHSKLQQWTQRHRWAAPLGIVFLPLWTYLCFSFVEQGLSWKGFGSLIVFLILPGLIFWKFPPQRNTLCWQDALVLLMIYIPFDHRYPDLIWAAPKGLSYVYSSLLLVTQIFFFYAILRKLPGLHFHWRPNRSEWYWSLLSFVGILILAVPIGWQTNFLTWNPQDLGVSSILLSFIGIFLSVALVEELVFRGVIQNLLMRSLNRPWVAIFITACLFGLSHWNNSKSVDWRYVGLATLAGVGYGIAYWKSDNSLLASSLSHTLIDTTWKHFLHT